MTQLVTGLDHLLILVNDLAAAAANMRRLGFVVSPRGVHSAHLGSANHTIMFQSDYLELWAVVTPTPLNAVHRANLALGEGVHTAALTATDIDGIATRLQHAGIKTEAPVRFSRPVQLPIGEAEAKFTVLRPKTGELPTGFMFFCRHHTPEAVWIPQWMNHPNTALGIEAVVIQTPRPSETARAYQPLFPGSEIRPISGGQQLPTGKAQLEFLHPDELSRRYSQAGVDQVSSPYFKVARIRARDLEAAARTLRAGGVALREEPGRVLVDPNESNGVLFEFVAGS